MESFEIYRAVGVGLIAPTLVTSVVLWIMALIKTRSRKDPARRAFIYLRIAFSFYAMFCLLYVAYGILSLLMNRLGYAIYYTGFNYISFVGGLFLNWTDCLLITALIRLGSGVQYAQDPNTASANKPYDIAATCVSSVLAVLAVVELGLSVATTFTSNIYTSQYDFITAESALYFIVSLLILARSIFVRVKSNNHLATLQASNILIVCSVMFVLRQLYNLAVIAASRTGNYPLGLIIVEVFFSLWPDFIILTILYALGAKKEGGLWSNGQPPVVAAVPNQGVPVVQNYNGTQYYVVQPPPQNGQQWQVPQYQMPQGYYQGAPGQGYPQQQYQVPAVPPTEMYQQPPEMSTISTPSEPSKEVAVENHTPVTKP